MRGSLPASSMFGLTRVLTKFDVYFWRIGSFDRQDRVTRFDRCCVKPERESPDDLSSRA